MWRAYGRPTGVAVVINANPLHAITDALGAYSYPVDYCSVNEGLCKLQMVAQKVGERRDFLKTISPDQLVGYVSHMLEYSSICIKHPSFSEEREWRIVYRPTQRASAMIKKSVISLGGVPQRVCSLQLDDRPGELEGISIPKLIDRIIVGPTLDSMQIKEALVMKMEELKITGAREKVVISGVPLR